jgi:peptidoglycan/LPS O-acetylase OafA/YrhL
LEVGWRGYRHRDFPITSLRVAAARSAVPESIPPVNSPAAVRQGSFIIGLESIRGLAALAVALFHSFHILPVDGALVYNSTIWNVASTDSLLMRLIMIPFNGGAAVSLFFVLSGFVLALSLRRDERALGSKAKGFALRRFVRIYPTLAINVVLFAAVIAMFASYLPAVPFTPFLPGQVVTNLLLLDFPVNGATWSLMIELVAIPFVFIGHCVVRRWGLFGLAVLVLVSVMVLFSPGLSFRMLIGDFVFMFLFGMLAAEIWQRKLISLSRTAAMAGVVAAIVMMLCARFLLGYLSKWSYLFEGLGSATLIAALVLGPRLAVHDVLERKPLRFLGRISYSFYLYHPVALALLLPVLTVVASPGWLQQHPFLGSAALAIPTVPAAILFGYVSFVLIEKPMMRFSHRL